MSREQIRAATGPSGQFLHAPCICIPGKRAGSPPPRSHSVGSRTHPCSGCESERREDSSETGKAWGSDMWRAEVMGRALSAEA
eukprot:scaffold211544_cov32-Tisochrysis_lutea.AAC.1